MKELQKQLHKARTENLKKEFELGESYNKALLPYTKAMMGASGITLFQAKTCVYYMMACHHLDKFDCFPLVVWFGVTASGKTEGMKQMCSLTKKEVAGIKAVTYTDLAKKLNKTDIAYIEEASYLQDRCEELLNNRAQKALRHQLIHLPPSQKAIEIDNFGATILHKREGFTDEAVRNRSIFIKTTRTVGYWKPTEVDRDRFDTLAEQLNITGGTLMRELVETKTRKISSRVLDYWEPILLVAEGCCDEWYLDQAMVVIEGEIRRGVPDDEPTEVAMQAVDCAYWAKANSGKAPDDWTNEPEYDRNIRLTAIVESSEKYLEIRKSPQWFSSNSRELGFDIHFYKGNHWLVGNSEIIMEWKGRKKG